MNQQEAMKLRHLIELYPIIKDEQKDRIKILISGKKFIVQNRQVRFDFIINIKVLFI